MTDDELLDLVNNAIRALLTGGAVKSWGEGGARFEHMSLADLRECKRELENNIASAGGGACCLPIRGVDC